MSDGGARWFSQDYASARDRFRAAARSAGATLDALPLEQSAPDGSPLTIDIAWLGPRRAARAVLHSSGLHGVEGFAGSAIQLALLADPPALPEDGALILAHALNPYGMAWLRRCNETNVDLNRNFEDTRPRSGAAAEYRLLDPLLNPPSPPARDLFFARAAYYVLRYGLKPLKQAIAEGQYEYPSGLFFGGRTLEPGPGIYQGWLAQHLHQLERLFAVDVHTGLGRWGQDELVIHRGAEHRGSLELAIGRDLSQEVSDEAVTYEIRGGYARAFDVLPERVRVCLVTQEFGTYSNLRVLHALREENRAHNHAPREVSHPAKLRLREMFAPQSARWRGQVVRRGVSLARGVFDLAFGQRTRGARPD